MNKNEFWSKDMPVRKRRRLFAYSRKGKNIKYKYHNAAIEMKELIKKTRDGKTRIEADKDFHYFVMQYNRL